MFLLIYSRKHPSFRLSIYFLIHPSIYYLYNCLSICLCIQPIIHLSIYSPIHSSIHPSNLFFYQSSNKSFYLLIPSSFTQLCRLVHLKYIHSYLHSFLHSSQLLLIHQNPSYSNYLSSNHSICHPNISIVSTFSNQQLFSITYDFEFIHFTVHLSVSHNHI